MPDRQPFIPPAFVLFLGILAVSSASIFIRFAQEEAPSLVIAAGRLLIATLILTPIALTRYRQELASMLRADLFLAVASGLFLALHFATWITSLEFTTVASSVVIVSTVPLWVGLLAPITIHESITRPLILGMLLALAGGIIVGFSDSCTIQEIKLVCPSLGEFLQGRAFLGNLLALAGALTAAGYLLIGRKLRARVSLISYIYVVYGMAAIILVLILIVAGESPFGYSRLTYLWLVLLAIFPQLIGHSTYNWALGYLSAAYVSIALLGEPIGSTILAYIVLNEAPTTLKIFGAILILSGILLASTGQASGVQQGGQETGDHV